MAQIAQCVIERASEPGDAYWEWAERLAPLWKGNHVVVSSADGPRYALDAISKAPVYAVSRDAFEFICAVSKSSRRTGVTRDLAVLPHDRMWLELPAAVGSFAIGVERVSAGWMIDVFANRGTWWMTFLFSIDSADLNSSITTTLFNEEMLKPSREDLVAIVGNLIWVLVMMNVSGALNCTRTITREGRIAAKRGRARQPCVLSFNSLDLPLRQGFGTRSPSRFTEGPGVRRHEVRGHHHLYRLRTGEMVLRWIAAYWRGNAAKGVVLKQRNLVPA